ncbi:hypothetical protein [Dokdonella sp.]|uniref:hypothetical protein n=1 Tax=Dokdonella sp. TaxID=2291710 RepID=UPI0026075072|nr:hypothetical protein [Dokdonella sp.]
MTFPRASFGWPALLLLLAVLQLPLALNPGYFSHDELQWAARADVSTWSALPWESWTDFGVFQYRPLTFNLWLLLSYALFATPMGMHAVFAGLGLLNAMLLGRAVQAAGAPRRAAMAAAAVFTLLPYAVYVHGWVGTLADLLVLLAVLFGVRLLQRNAAGPPFLVTGLLLALLTCAALLSKESAIVLPAALLPALHRHPHPRRALALVAVAGLPVVAYLALRLPVILSTPAGSESYAWSIGHVPARLAEYLAYPFLPPLFEVGSTLSKSPARLLLAAACLAALLGALASAGWRWSGAWIALVVALLAPVLVLPASYAQYAYLAGAAAVGLAAVAWPHLNRAPRIALGIATAVAVAHGATVMARMHRIGVVQHRFHTDLSALVAQTREAPRIALADENDRWMAARFLREVPSYRGARLAEPGEPAPFLMRRDGRIVRTTP